MGGSGAALFHFPIQSAALGLLELRIFYRSRYPAVLFNKEANRDNLFVLHQCEEVRRVFRYGDDIARLKLYVKVADIIGAFNNEDPFAANDRTDFVFRVGVNFFEFFSRSSILGVDSESVMTSQIL